MTNTYMDRIKEVLVNNDTNKDIYDKIVDKYPELLDGKVQQFDGDEKMIEQNDPFDIHLLIITQTRSMMMMI